MVNEQPGKSKPILIAPTAFDESPELRETPSLPCNTCGSPRQSNSRFCTACGVPFETPNETRPYPKNLPSSIPVPAKYRDRGDFASSQTINRSAPSSEGATSIEVDQSHAFHCDNCGANIDLPPGLSSIRCPFCDSTYVIRMPDEERRKHRPEFVIGFAVTKEQAAEKFFEWLGKNSWFRPGDLRNAAITDKQQGVYLPFWHFTLGTRSEWSARVGEFWYRTEYYTVEVNGKRERRSRVVQETEWWPLNGIFRKYYSGYMVSASKGLPQNEALAIQPYRLGSLMRFRPHYLAGWLVEEYSIERNEALGVAKSEFMSREKDAISRFMPGDVVSGLSVYTHFDEGDTDLILLPVHILTYKYRDKIFRFMVNGQTGKVYGEKPWSGRRITALVIGIAVLILAAVLFVILTHREGLN
jgi:LSD1 subclass zinc finger protein